MNNNFTWLATESNRRVRIKMPFHGYRSRHSRLFTVQRVTVPFNRISIHGSTNWSQNLSYYYGTMENATFSNSFGYDIMGKMKLLIICFIRFDRFDTCALPIRKFLLNFIFPRNYSISLVLWSIVVFFSNSISIRGNNNAWRK